MLLFSTTNMAALTSRADQQLNNYTVKNSPLHLVTGRYVFILGLNTLLNQSIKIAYCSSF